MAALPPRANTTSALPVAPSASSSAPSSSAVSSSLTDKQKEDALFKKFMQERTRKLEELQATHTVLARNVPADADSLAAANHVGGTKAAVVRWILFFARSFLLRDTDEYGIQPCASCVDSIRLPKSNRTGPVSSEQRKRPSPCSATSSTSASMTCCSKLTAR
ncbi:hypothetical protein BC936DRAFT_136810 [Jimgerdemannia flammicorona]|uniref:Uncharacterized protein n=1 Tax=Jimgerdemannia flammicorona TaxID=994334 RepID=A0A433CYR4_9FUNG|nr:hypothetical protein BC936DRAFT_136810 [Jimgerdemannia flammicorona]RUP43727.1 hypothetical protein BC936DRAFT_136810 [Jimgerdemannia flammicorona]